ncbi:hypothetical protein EH223_14595 [candidate division KSB1 bacterium]|nr:hypothetical protein [candidate division KSB1 bacterium]RQW01544.1 MAG: hypothetical protein EH223_14595 [candidate division KSB1 bacterium]
MKSFTFSVKAVIHQTIWTNRFIALVVGLLISTCVTWAGSLIATWDANSEPDLAGYIVCYGTQSANYTEQVDVKNSTTFIAEDLQDGVKYYFVIKAYDHSGNVSAPSTEVSAVVGSPMLVAMKEDKAIRLVWTPVHNCDTFEIFRSQNPYFTPTTAIATLSATDHEYIDTHHFTSNQHETYYTVRALAGGQTIHEYQTVGAYNIDIHTGLNLVSFPLIPADPSVRASFADQLTGGENSAEADQLRFWNGEEYLVAWLYEGSAVEFNDTWISAATGKETQHKVDPSAAFWILVQEGHSETALTITGCVPTEAERTITLMQGHNFIGCIFPLTTSLEKTELYQDGVMKGGVGSGESDILNAWDGTGYERAWVVDGVNDDLDGTWMDETGKQEATVTFQPGKGYIIWIKGDNECKVWTFPNPAFAD